MCATLASISQSALIFSICGSIVTAVVSILLGLSIRALSYFEGHTSTEKQDVSIAFRTFVVTVVNSALLIVLVNANLHQCRLATLNNSHDITALRLLLYTFLIFSCHLDSTSLLCPLTIQAKHSLSVPLRIPFGYS
jgi:hypothetical protein